MNTDIKLNHGDCMDALREMEDNQFDLAIVDPPYGIGFDGYTTNTKANSKWKNKTAKVYDRKDWDKKSPSREYFRELRRVSVNQIIWGANHFIDDIGDSRNSPCWVLWDKKNDGKNQADCEMAWASFDTTVRMFRFLWDGMRQESIKNKEVRIHPTQKPVALYKWLLNNYAKEGDSILDTHLGSGSIAIACHDLGFDLTGFELDADYYASAVARLDKHRSQAQFDF